jgi:hypothetical protein
VWGQCGIHSSSVRRGHHPLSIVWVLKRLLPVSLGDREELGEAGTFSGDMRVRLDVCRGGLLTKEGKKERGLGSGHRTCDMRDHRG